MFEHMAFMSIEVVFSAKAHGTLPPYLGSTIRGIIGHCMREFSCDSPEIKCFCCNKRETCVYVRCFSNTGGEAGAVNPYMLHVRNSGKTEWNAGDECIFDLTLIGEAVSNAGVYLDAIRRMEKKGWGAARIPFRLERIVNSHDDTLIYAAGGHSWLRNLNGHLFQFPQRKAGMVLIEFDTPVRIVSGKQLCRTLSFYVIVQFLIRRIALLSQAFTDHLIEWNEEAILECAEKVETRSQSWIDVDFRRYSMTKAENKLELPAIQGWALYEGEISRLVPLLEIGTYLHVGKGATIGFGHYNTYYDKKTEGKDV